ncbi:hypothetical protein BW721_05880 [Jeotgalibaca sp. PTS2502]|uniref:glycosyltransferase n=1 Tax=Jeotgalibaca sp. PTS2502 TaxID=1903686 RepID=UPI000973D501|nr:glycosyltransferase [Jeotgalibaca sp. PTS2502]APZ49243.1 hypothetical protein BW721_05880 [Jeotgalibaca sp. PTS2502]
METLVIMTTYNGEKYVEEQLISIYNQTLRPDKVIISDDKSTDKTYSIIQSFIERNKLNNEWFIRVNKQNIGWRQNFSSILNEFEADYIFLCDQDDIWYENKVENMLKIMNENKKIKLLTTDYTPIYEGENTIKISKNIMRTMKNDNTVHKINISEKMYSVLRPGCTYCITRELIELFREYSYDNTSHDSILWNISLLFDGLYNYSSPKIYFRRHEENNTPLISRNKKSMIHNIKQMLTVSDNLLDLIMNYSNKIENYNKKVKLLQNQKMFYLLRLEMFEKRKYKNFLKVIFKYKKFYLSKKRILLDCILLFR